MSHGIIIASETEQGAFELLSKGRELAQQLKMPIAALRFGDANAKVAQEYFDYGAQTLYTTPNIEPNSLNSETYTQVLYEAAKSDASQILLLTSSKLGKETAGRVAQRLQAGCITDAIGLHVQDSQLVAQRYALGGNTISSEIIESPTKVISVMPRTFEAEPKPTQGQTRALDIKPPPQRIQVIERKAKTGESINIESAENLVCVGQGIAKQEDLRIINDLCSALKAEIGCTRALSSDLHWLSEDRMVGISGKRCKPKLHISIGISGQIQHTVGVLSSKLIVAINKDKEAPIFKIADYGIVGDLYEIVPKLTERLRNRT